MFVLSNVATSSFRQATVKPFDNALMVSQAPYSRGRNYPISSQSGRSQGSLSCPLSSPHPSQPALRSTPLHVKPPLPRRTALLPASREMASKCVYHVVWITMQPYMELIHLELADTKHMEQGESDALKADCMAGCAAGRARRHCPPAAPTQSVRGQPASRAHRRGPPPCTA